jgi:hypothetical protein
MYVCMSLTVPLEEPCPTGGVAVESHGVEILNHFLRESDTLTTFEGHHAYACVINNKYIAVYVYVCMYVVCINSSKLFQVALT